MRMLLFYSVTAIFIAGCTPIAQNSVNSGGNPKILRLRDLAYEPQIKTVTLHPATTDPQATLEPAVMHITDGSLVLAFDDLTTARDTYYARIIHCNADWSKSTLMDLDFMYDFNEFPVNNFEFSVDSHVPYVHYWLQVPRVKVPGNYVMAVYRGTDKNDIILTKRFMVIDPRVTFQGEGNLIGAGALASMNQQLNFTVNYKNIEIINPLENVKVVIRQNQRWDNIVMDVKPSFVREIEHELEYRFFDDSKMFKGGNEFRFFDLRSLNNPGRNVANVNRTVKPFEVFIERDKSRQHDAYSQYLDMNGGFVLDNLDFRSANFANYAYVNFALASRPISGDVYVTGAFHQWNLNNENRMLYDSAKQEYYASFLLKQGWYDYQYLVKSKELPPYVLEGSHFETENMYEIFVYYQPFQPRADLLIGYLRLQKNPR
ncbi:MAG TPA: DUF5103 domain-containing protein [Chryseosolibacter sp.]|nr:DUF5103 domain-containing protein [Chryseosolibacter sp.]